MNRIEYATKQVLFNFNKKYLEDPTIPMWMLTFSGQQYYVNHVDCNINWSTRERPDHNSTKGTIVLNDCLVVIDDTNTAIISQLTEHDKIRLKNREKGITRIITEYGTLLRSSLQQTSINHGPIKTAGGGCGTLWFITDILKPEHVTMLQIQMGDKIRILKENESYYKYYDDPAAYGDEYEDDEYDY